MPDDAFSDPKSVMNQHIEWLRVKAAEVGHDHASEFRHEANNLEVVIAYERLATKRR